MPDQTQIIFSTGALDVGFCPSNEQQRFDMYARRLIGTMPGISATFVMGTAVPDPGLHKDKAWLRLKDDGNIDRWYKFADGAWLSPHPLPQGAIMLYMGADNTIATFDGGTAGTADTYNGPFWEPVPNAAGRVPVHPDPTKTVIVNQTGMIGASGTNAVIEGTRGGFERHQLTSAEMPTHSHNTTVMGHLNVGSGALGGWGQIANNHATSSTGGGGFHNNMQPFIGVYMIRRTARLYYKVI